MSNLAIRAMAFISVIMASALLMCRAADADDKMPVISNFKLGLVCGTADNRRVCFQTDNIQVTNESTCTYNRTQIACTWFGYSFDYEVEQDVAINCEVDSDIPQTYGNPREAGATATTSSKYDIELKRGSHHFYMGEYVGGVQSEAAPMLVSDKFLCSLNGVPLLSKVYTIERTDSPAPAESLPDMNTVPN